MAEEPKYGTAGSAEVAEETASRSSAVSGIVALCALAYPLLVAGSVAGCVIDWFVGTLFFGKAVEAWRFDRAGVYLQLYEANAALEFQRVPDFIASLRAVAAIQLLAFLKRRGAVVHLAIAALAAGPVLRREWDWATYLSLTVTAIALCWFALPGVDYVLRVRREREAMRTGAELAVPAIPFERTYFHRGIVLTAENGFGYSGEAARSMLPLLPVMGATEVALIPKIDVGADPMDLRPGRFAETSESEGGMLLLSSLAHRSRMRIMLKPHLSRIPSKAELASPESRRAWLARYKAAALHYARLAQRIHADTYSIGNEMGWLTTDEAAWREIVRAVRAQYSGALTYAAASGEEFERIGFWDEFDYIGLNNYYALGPGFDTREVVHKVEQVQKRFNKPVLFTEAGCASIKGARTRPRAETGDYSPDDQASVYSQLMAAFYEKPWFAGVYWWKIPTDGSGGPGDTSMSAWRKHAVRVVNKWFHVERGAPSAD